MTALDRQQAVLRALVAALVGRRAARGSGRPAHLRCRRRAGRRPRRSPSSSSARPMRRAPTPRPRSLVFDVDVWDRYALGGRPVPPARHHGPRPPHPAPAAARGDRVAPHPAPLHGAQGPFRDPDGITLHGVVTVRRWPARDGWRSTASELGRSFLPGGTRCSRPAGRRTHLQGVASRRVSRESRMKSPNRKDPSCPHPRAKACCCASTRPARPSSRPAACGPSRSSAPIAKVDVTSADSAGRWQELLPGAAAQSMAFSASDFVWLNDTAYQSLPDRLRGRHAAGLPDRLSRRGLLPGQLRRHPARRIGAARQGNLVGADARERAACRSGPRARRLDPVGAAFPLEDGCNRPMTNTLRGEFGATVGGETSALRHHARHASRESRRAAAAARSWRSSTRSSSGRRAADQIALLAAALCRADTRPRTPQALAGAGHGGRSRGLHPGPHGRARLQAGAAAGRRMARTNALWTDRPVAPLARVRARLPDLERGGVLGLLLGWLSRRLGRASPLRARPRSRRSSGEPRRKPRISIDDFAAWRAPAMGGPA